MLSSEDKERIENAANEFSTIDTFHDYTSFQKGAEYEHPIAFNQGKIEGFNEGFASRQKEIDELKQFCKLGGTLDRANIKGFNEGIEAARKILWEYRMKSYHSIAEIDERIEKLKKK